MDTASRPRLQTAAGDTCANCRARLAPDQRYCVQCGARRGSARPPAYESRSVRREVVAAPARPRGASSATFVAGVATLILAMGVGVLIGRSTQKTAPQRAETPVKVVTVGGGAPVASATTTPTGSGGHAAKASHAKAGHGKQKTAPPPKPATQNVKGANLQLPKQSVVKVGQKGTGPGYQHGKFTGNFFGP